jgi:hypothetical protein
MAAKTDFDDDEEASLGTTHSSMMPIIHALRPEIGSRRPSTLPLTNPTSFEATLPKTPSRDMFNWEREIYFNNGDRRASVGSMVNYPSAAARLSKQRLRPVTLY